MTGAPRPRGVSGALAPPTAQETDSLSAIPATPSRAIIAAGPLALPARGAP
jgi:hypothetical protein